MDLSCLLDDPAPLKKMQFKTSLCETDFAYFEELFDMHHGNISPKIVSDFALKRGTEREPVRMWFMNRKMREHKSLLKKYKRARESIDRSMAKDVQSITSTENLSQMYIKMLEDAQAINSLSAAYTSGKYGQNKKITT
eukprot:NODE_162_length_16547_cov_0.334326.p9 type:complete len:138 gc:universal NODE_162_length_16547_cov_0.334326:11354-10941(-)